MKKTKNERHVTVYGENEEVPCYNANDVLVTSPSESSGVAIVSALRQTVTEVTRSKENVKIAKLSAKIKLKEIESDFVNQFHEEENVHNEVMANLTNITSAMDIIKSNPELSSDKDVIISLLDSINNGAKQSIEARKSKHKDK